MSYYAATGQGAILLTVFRKQRGRERAGIERYFHELSEPAEYPGGPPHSSPLDHERLVTTAACYGCLVLDRPTAL